MVKPKTYPRKEPATVKPVKVSEWLTANVDSHAIHDHLALAADFHNATGDAACWPAHSMAATRATIKARGLGGSVNGPENGKLCYGYEVAEALAHKYASGFTTTKMGRGSIFRECITEIEAAEKRAE